MKIALVELSESHEECMFSQVSFLADAGHEVSLYIHPKIDVESYKEFAIPIFRYDFDALSKMKRLPLQLKLVNHLKTFDKVIFNTASSSKSLRNVVVFLNGYKTECIGVVHHVRKLNKSFTQKIISTKIKKYFTLSDALKNNIQLKDKSLKLESFYPIFFPSTEKVRLSKKENEVWICIPGRVFFDRRDYQFLVEKLSQINIPKLLKFIILGNINNQDGLKLKQQLEKHQVSDAFVIFEKFIPNSAYYSYLEHSDFIMPLLQKQDKNYIDSKITGAFNLAFGFKKPLLFHKFYEVIPDLKANGISYNDANFENILNAIANRTIEIPSLYQDKKWSYEYQQKKYINFINS
ncbi:hypothetical protein LX77_01635 [Gelidibacter algens]|uniref:Glycosyltransferase involved in cell wall biosynthesis n=1 Tax=Gelidibacter algens TaxID=49280 RepID=A0A1A7R157_9FLAO|nr:hypothetical protein [Gelidibacter algens]OBX24512.1 hypothetical protein A9996_14980 [Gelidibacter algens]RAJ25332.1 hypothetical protein LX77_01635 [Gelidibacter algens]